MKIVISLASFFIVQLFSAQKIENAESLRPFLDKLKANVEVTNILLIGDSHIQAGTLPILLKDYFQNKYGNAGRGVVFPYQVANSNGPVDYASFTNQTWQNFRLSYAQDIFENMGAAGFVLGNEKKSIIQIKLENPQDAFSKVIVFNNDKMKGDTLITYQADDTLKLTDYIKVEKKIIEYKIEENMTYPEIASKFYTTTTRLTQLNGVSIQNPVPGRNVKVEAAEIIYDDSFKEKLSVNSKNIISSDTTVITFKKASQNFIIENNPKDQNLFYGFQFLNNCKKGVVFNAVGVNGATYGDYFKYALTLNQLNKLQSDMVIITLGTNESVNKITKEEFKTDAAKVIKKLREKNQTIPILLINPTGNNLAAAKVQQVGVWVKEIAKEQNTAFLDNYTMMGGSSYFTKALKSNDARTDKVHFNQSGYEKQAAKIWEKINEILK